MGSFKTGIGDSRGDQLDRSDGIVVPGDGVIDAVWVAIGVHDRDDRDAQSVGLLNCNTLDAGVEHKDTSGKAIHVLDPAEILLELDPLFLHLAEFFLGQTVVGAIG